MKKVRSNLATRATQLLSLQHPYSDDPPLSQVGTTILAPCDCDDMADHCLHQGRIVTRVQVCSGGDGQDTMGDCARDGGGISPVFVGVLAALLAALVTAVVVGAACRLYDWQGGDREEGQEKREA